MQPEAAQARNVGVMHARHGVLAFIDADDDLSGALANAARFLVQNPRQPSVRLDVEYCGFPEEIVRHPRFHERFRNRPATRCRAVSSFAGPCFSRSAGFPIDEIF